MGFPTASRDRRISLEFTPNPNTLKYVADRLFLQKGCVNFTAPGEAEGVSVLAQGLFRVPGIAGVMIGRDFVTVTRGENGDWDEIHSGAIRVLAGHLDSGLPSVDPAWLSRSVPHGDSGTVGRIIEILENEIRPAVAMDGGDIEFDRFEGGVVYLHLQGACSGCPGAAMTLKMGVEARLREEIPEVREVVAV